jgi:hypothetical protein
LNSCNINDQSSDELLEQVKTRFNQLDDARCQRRVFLNRLRALVSFGAEKMDYEVPAEMELPKELEIALAVCHPECGNQAYVVVDAGPQSCDCCGGTMYPVSSAIYRLKKK